MWSKSFNITMIYIIQKRQHFVKFLSARSLEFIVSREWYWLVHLWTEVNVLHNHLVYIIQKDNA